jgi:[acyl-carrier-protein] S-malonyltransferase
MSEVAWVFPGQGSQTVCMGKALYANSAAARHIYERADAALGFYLSHLCFEGPQAELDRTMNAQPALLTTSIAHLAALRERGVLTTLPAFLAGHSLGEYSALVAGEAMELGEAVRFVHERGVAMQFAGDGVEGGSSMAAVIGADDAMLAEVCAACGVDLANFNAPGQTVISGPKSAVDDAMAQIKARGGRRIVPLAVSIASHSRLMRPAAGTLAPILAAVDVEHPIAPLVPNVTAHPTSDPVEIRRLLLEQLYSPVRWVESIQAMTAAGVTTFWEIGAGKVLAGLIKRIAPDATVENSEAHL